jgi:hypothetical protein
MTPPLTACTDRVPLLGLRNVVTVTIASSGSMMIVT